MFRKKSRPAPANGPLVYRQLSERLVEVEYQLDEFAATTERLQQQNQALKIEVGRLSLQLSEAREARPARSNLYSKWSASEAEIDIDEPEVRTNSGPGLIFWMLTLLISAAAGFGTFYLMRPFAGPL